MEFLMKSLEDTTMKTHIKLNPRTSVQINKNIRNKVKAHKKSFKEIGYDVTDMQVINAGLDALDVVKPTDTNLMKLELIKKANENNKMMQTITALHLQIQKLKKQNANPTNK